MLGLGSLVITLSINDVGDLGPSFSLALTGSLMIFFAVLSRGPSLNSCSQRCKSLPLFVLQSVSH